MHSHPQHTDRRGRRPSRRGRTLIALLAAFLTACGLITATAGPASAAPPDVNRLATFNMQYGPSQWSNAYDLARTNDVVALQEVPFGAVPTAAEQQLTVNGVEHYIWQEGDRAPRRHLYILRHHTRNLGMITEFVPDNVMEVESVYRPALAVFRDRDDTMFASLHARSRGGSDVGALLRIIAATAERSDTTNWVALGDFNRNPETIPDVLPPPGSRIYNTGQTTYRTGGEYDYMVANYATDNWRATREPGNASDHWPVTFSAAVPPVADDGTTLEIHVDHTGQNLHVVGGDGANGNDIMQFPDINHESALFQLSPNGTDESGQTMYRIVTDTSERCLDVENGRESVSGSPLHVWDCHAPDGAPEPGGPLADSQNWVLEHPDPRFPNRLMLRNVESDMYANVSGGSSDVRSRLIQYPWEGDAGGHPVRHEIFYVHPQISATQPDPA
ncbi:RICIN domain-containing protein [Streptomyces sp. NBC_01092]|uniref:RICIN domain-containing protein n=1 Tax=Streptomyces sp. NBC_01092 TaxID=2903748 RepID=UPI0038639916|nr:RICIN domain-containing protein [Streptomyces sp. NBC_01092]